MPNSERKRLVEDLPKMNSMLISTAKFIAEILQYTDDEVDPKTPFVEVSRQHLHYLISLASDGRVQLMQKLMHMYDFCVKAEHLANRMRHCSIDCRGENMDLSLFAQEVPYFGGDQLITEGTTCTTIDVGDIGKRLMVDVRAQAFEWLYELDRVLCACSLIPFRELAGDDKILSGVKNYLAHAIAERLTMMSHESVLNDSLSSRCLEEVLKQIYEDAMEIVAEEKSKAAVLARLLLTLAENPESDESRDILESHGKLRDMMSNPPDELTKRKSAINFDRLSRALAPGIDIECRVALVLFWREASKNACTEIREALDEITSWAPSDNNVQFHSILSRQEQGRRRGYLIPPFKCLYMPRCSVPKQTERRGNLPDAAGRAKCLVTAIWEMASRGFFQAGVLAAEIVTPVALDAILMARFAAKRICDERDVKNLGFRMSSFISKLYDMEGNFVKKLDKAACHLSMFSCKELETVFDTQNDSLYWLCGRLTAVTRNSMVYSPNITYDSFATDALAILLPLIEARRNRIGISSFLRPNAFIDMIRTIKRVNEWEPTKGTLQLHLEDLKDAHPDCRRVFDDLHDQHTLVRRLGSQRSHNKITYRFDTYTLWQLVTEFTAFTVT